MSFRVQELRRAQTDVRHIFSWLHERSPSGANSWLRAYDRLVDRLKDAAGSFGEADENADLVLDVRQALFKTRRGRVYRALFYIDGATVYVLRVRGPGQAPVETDDLDT